MIRKQRARISSEITWLATHGHRGCLGELLPGLNVFSIVWPDCNFCKMVSRAS